MRFIREDHSRVYWDEHWPSHSLWPRGSQDICHGKTLTAAPIDRNKIQTCRKSARRSPAGDDADSVASAAWSSIWGGIAVETDGPDSVGHGQRSRQPDQRQVAGHAATAGDERRMNNDVVDGWDLDAVDVVAVQVYGTCSYRQARRVDTPRQPAQQ